MKKIYLGLGSNIGRREEHLQSCIDRLATPDLHLLRTSQAYETAPRDMVDQPWFLNLVLECETSLFPVQLLKRIQRIEKELGRHRAVDKGPRTIDIDILLYGAFVIEQPILVVPHPRMHERRFVLEPLAELVPDLRHPAMRRTVREMLGGTAGQALHRSSWRPVLPGVEGAS